MYIVAYLVKGKETLLGDEQTEERRERLHSLQLQLEDTNALISETRAVINEGEEPDEELHALSGNDDSMEETMERLLNERAFLQEEIDRLSRM